MFFLYCKTETFRDSIFVFVNKSLTDDAVVRKIQKVRVESFTHADIHQVILITANQYVYFSLDAYDTFSNKVSAAINDFGKFRNLSFEDKYDYINNYQNKHMKLKDKEKIYKNDVSLVKEKFTVSYNIINNHNILLTSPENKNFIKVHNKNNIDFCKIKEFLAKYNMSIPNVFISEIKVNTTKINGDKNIESIKCTINSKTSYANLILIIMFVVTPIIIIISIITVCYTKFHKKPENKISSNTDVNTNQATENNRDSFVHIYEVPNDFCEQKILNQTTREKNNMSNQNKPYYYELENIEQQTINIIEQQP
jgi:hypothetical protein